jgi:hypothetical protein
MINPGRRITLAVRGFGYFRESRHARSVPFEDFSHVTHDDFSIAENISGTGTWNRYLMQSSRVASTKVMWEQHEHGKIAEI